jgi:hypothetical protein
MFDPYAITAVAFLVMALFGGHAVADYGLQSAYVAEFKVRSERNPDWFVTLGAHCLIHGFLVLVSVVGCAFVLGLISGQPWLPALRLAALLGTWLGWAESIVHFAIDDAKGQQRFSYRIDQLLHYGCKLLWASIVLYAIG